MPVVPPPAFALAAAAAQHKLARRGARTHKVAATAVAAASAALIGGSVARFAQRKTTVHPFHPDHATSLVTDGPNALTRNPMYVGMAGLLTAHALARGGIATTLPVAAFVAIIDRVQIRPEEAALRQNFGAEYDAYRARVPRWLGPLGQARA